MLQSNKCIYVSWLKIEENSQLDPNSNFESKHDLQTSNEIFSKTNGVVPKHEKASKHLHKIAFIENFSR